MKNQKYLIIILSLIICLLIGTLCAQYPTKSKSKNELLKDIEKEFVEYQKKHDKVVMEQEKQFEKEMKLFEERIKKLIKEN